MLSWEIDPDQHYDEFTESLYGYVIWRDDYLCLLCACAADHVHHVIFRSQGGTNSANNLACLCRKCHDGSAHGAAATNIQAVLLKLIAKKEAQFRSDLL